MQRSIFLSCWTKPGFRHFAANNLSLVPHHVDHFYNLVKHYHSLILDFWNNLHRQIPLVNHRRLRTCSLYNGPVFRYSGNLLINESRTNSEIRHPDNLSLVVRLVMTSYLVFESRWKIFNTMLHHCCMPLKFLSRCPLGGIKRLVLVSVLSWLLAKQYICFHYESE